MKRTPEEVIELLRSYTTERYFDEGLTELLQEAADTIEQLNTMRQEEIRRQEAISVFTKVAEQTARLSHGGHQEKEITKPDLHAEICAELTDTYMAKNHDYGDSFARIRERYPQAIMIRLWDKLLRLETLLFGEKAAVNESIEDTLKDMANYAIMELVERQIDREGKTK